MNGQEERYKSESHQQAFSPLISFIFLALTSVLIFGCLQSPSDAYSVQDGRIHYPENRPVPLFNATVLEDTSNHTLTYLTYQSHGGVIVHALLRVPKTDASGANGAYGVAVSKPPVVILLPGATVPKEGRQPLAVQMQNWGYATLALDVRGNGNTSRLHSLDDDYAAFIAGSEPEEAQVTYDVLAGFDVVSSKPEWGLDTNKVGLWGESMGGRYAIIAAAIEPKFKGVLLVSSAGFGLPNGRTVQETAFLRLIDPDNYVGQIAPRPLYLLHNPADKTIPYGSAQFTFAHAGEPKRLTDFACPAPLLHGYCKEMDGEIKDALGRIFGS